MIKYRIKHLALFLFALMNLSSVSLAGEPVSKGFFGGVAIDAYDSVAYHSESASPEHQIEKGNKKFTVEYKGAKWLFANKENADMFKADPDKYSPAYNGHCANALSLGEGLVKTDGTHWEILGDRLYLFYAESGRERWLDGEFNAYKAAADKAWQAILAD